jgi:predicted nucleic acid-binding protein
LVRLDSFRKSLRRLSAVYIDTNVLIYHLEDTAPYSELTQILFDLIERGNLKGHTSTLSLLELNVKPYQLNRPDKAVTHIALLKNLPHFSIQPLTLEMADRAAQMRAKYQLKTPDAIHLASALECRCDTMIGNDQNLKKVKEIHYLHLDHFVE